MANRILALIASLVLLCTARLAIADDLDAATTEFWAGDEAYAAGDFERAIEHFIQADQLTPNLLVYEYIGRAYLQLGDQSSAIQAFERYAEASPEAAAEVEVVIAELGAGLWQGVSGAARFSVWRAIGVARGDESDPEERRRNELGATAMRDVPVQILSEPRGAEVFIDGTEYGPFGITPLNVDLFVGAHRIELRRAHHTPVTIDVELEANTGVAVFRAELIREVIEVDLTFVPTTARVGPLPAGPCVFVLQGVGRDRRIETTVELTPPETIYERTFELEAARGFGAFDIAIGTIVVESGVEQAEVYVDGQRIGRGAGSFETDVSVGVHTVEVRRDGYETYRSEVRAEPDGEHSLEVGELERRRRRR
jgi:hypothetical protein